MTGPGRLAAVAALLAAVAPPALAADLQASATVDRDRLGIEDTLVLTVRAEGTDAGRVNPPSLSGLRDFRVVQGPGTSTQFQWVNGRAFAAKSFTYVLMPQRAGHVQIPALTLEGAGSTLRTEAIAVEVIQGSVTPPAGRRLPAPGRPSPPGTRQPPASAPAPSGSAQVKVEAELDRERAYVGQQVTLTYRIFTQLDITGLELTEAPAYPGFWVEDLKVDPNPVGRRAVRDGQEYTEFTVMKKALFPTRAGRLEIPALTFSLGVRGAGGDPFEGMFFGTGQTLYRKSPARVVEVEPLPEEGRPASFGGAVGRFRLTVTPDRQESKVNDAISLRVRVDGDGNVRSVTTPALPALADFKAYDPKVDEKSAPEGDRLKGSKTWDFVLLPLAAGLQEIPPIEFSYFDPGSSRFHTLRSPPIRLQVARADSEAGPSLAAVQPREVRPMASDIRHLRPAPARLVDRSRRGIGGPLLAVALFVPVAGNLLLGLGRWRREALQADRGSLRRRRAGRAARRALKQAAAVDGAPSRFYEAVSRALREYVADKLDRAAAGLTLQEIEQALEAAGVNSADRLLLHGCLEACDRGRFAPASARTAARADLVGQARRAVDRLESQL